MLALVSNIPNTKLSTLLKGEAIHPTDTGEEGKLVPEARLGPRTFRIKELRQIS